MYIAAITDALDRKGQPDARPTGGGNGPSGIGGDNQAVPSGGGPGRGHVGVVRKATTKIKGEIIRSQKMPNTRAEMPIR